MSKIVIIGFIILISLVSSVHGEPDTFGIAQNITFQESLSSKYPIWGCSGRFSTVDSGGVGVSSSVALDKNGYTRISYADTTNGHLKYAWQNSSGWNNYSGWYNTTIDSSDSVGRGTSLKQDSNGFSHISYLDSANHALKYARQNESGWQINLLESGGIGGVQTSLALDNAGYPHICYFNDLSRELKYTWQNGSGWWNTTLDGTGTAADYTSLALDNSSHAHVSYYNSILGDLRYTWEDDLGWHRSTIDSEGDVGNYSSLALDSSGYAHISYLDATNGHLKYAWQNSSGWFNSTVYSGPGAGGYSSLVIDSEGNAHFSCSGGPHESVLVGTEYDGEFRFFPLPFGSDSLGGTYTSLALDSEEYFHISYAQGSIPALQYFYGHVGPIPVMNFTINVTSGIAPLTVQFNDTSIGPVTRWGWDFGDGNYSTEQNTVHTYTFPGHFLMEHSVSSRDGTGIARRYIDVFSLPVANFTGTPTFGTTPLTVSFTDLSTNNPTGWAWFFGDEDYTAPWTQMNASTGWSARRSHSSVVMPDGSIVLMGGRAGESTFWDDVWRSKDNGVAWVLVNATPGWSARYSHSSVVMPDGSIILMGGMTGSLMNDVWRSTDNGTTWTEMTPSAGWSARAHHSTVVLPDGSIVLMGGTESGAYLNDVWRSTDNGMTWTEMTPSAGWSPRAAHSSVVLPDGSIVLMGGLDASGNRNDVWRSTDKGTTWTMMTPGARWSARHALSSVAMPDGSIALMGGSLSVSSFENDVWQSRDNGATWTEIPHAGWSARCYHTSVVMPDGSIVLVGGGSNISDKNDVWRFQSAGSSAQNPSHTYTSPGIYQVTLQVFNQDGYNSTRKAGYITVFLSDDGGSDSGGDIPSPFTPPPTTTLIGKTITEMVNVGGGSAVSRAEVTGTNLGKNLVVAAFPRNNLPSGISLTQTTVYQYLSIVSSTIPGVIDQAILEFSVPQAWLTEHGFTKGDVVMMHYDNGKWVKLDTRYVSQNSGNVFYRSTTPGFSYFAIVYQKDGTDMGAVTPDATTSPTPVTVLKAPVQEAPSPIEITREKTPAVPPALATQPSGGIPMRTIIIGTTGAIATVIGTVLIRRWWIRKQNPTLFRKNDRY